MSDLEKALAEVTEAGDRLSFARVILQSVGGCPLVPKLDELDAAIIRVCGELRDRIDHPKDF